MLEAGMNERSAFGERLCRQIEIGDVDKVRSLLQIYGQPDNGFDINDPCNPGAYAPISPLTMALLANDPAMVSLILRQPGLDVARSLPHYDTWLWVRSASLETLRLFLAHPGDALNLADGNGKTALHEAVAHGVDAAKVDCLLEHEAAADPTQNDGTTPLYRSALSGNVAAAEALMRYPVDVNNRNSDNLWTVLMVAVAEDSPQIVKLLLARDDVDVNARSDVMETALHIAADRGYVSSVKLLLERRDIRVNEKNRSGWTPLTKAAFAGHVEIVKVLCARKDVALNAVDQDRQTALHWAVLAGNIEVVRVLLKQPEINVSLTNRPQMQTAYDLALAMHYDAIADLLRLRAAAGESEDELSPDDVYEPRQTEDSARFPIMPAIADPPRSRPSKRRE
jgi:ankyrin repeat protein